jgi:protocatechuate 3,4-dioxygenase beta subunit
MARLSIFLFVLLCGALAALAGDTPPTWEGIVSYKGKPVAGAKVGLLPDAAIPDKLLFATTDDKGRFCFPTGTAPPMTFARVLVRDKAGRGGFGTLGRFATAPPEIELHENAELAGRFTDAAGKPIPGLALKPVALGPGSFASYGGRPVVLAETPAWFSDGFPVTVAADGSFTVPGVPAGQSVALRFEAAGLGTGRLWVQPSKPAVLGLGRAGAVTVRLTPPAAGKPGDVAVTVTRQADASLLEATASGTAKAGGEVVLASLPPGTYQVRFPYTGPTEFFPRPVPPVTIAPGAMAMVTTPLEPAARVAATLVDARTGQGVAGAGLSASVALPDGHSVTVPAVLSDAGGKVRLLVPAGMVSVTPVAADGYAVTKFTANPFNQSSSEPSPVGPGQERDFGRFALVPTVNLAGTVVDPTGEPVPGARVSAGYSASSFVKGGPVVSDAKGGFVLKGVNPEGGVIGVTARRGKQITAAPVAVDPAKSDGGLRVVVSEAFAARVRVRAVDSAGQPVAYAAVDLAHSVRTLASGSGPVGFGTAMKVGVTGADGRFESDVLQAGDRYSVTLWAPGFRKATTEEIQARPGEAHDFGDVRLTRADLSVKGTVTDPAGQPVAGAAVFSNADGPQPTATTSDAAGRFTLGGLFEGPAFVSVRADGFRLASVPAEPGGLVVVVRLRRLTDPPAAPPVISDAHRAATAKLTRHLLTRMWAERVNAGDDGKGPLRAMARLDFAAAKRWAAEEKARTGGKADLAPLLDLEGGGRPLVAVARDDPDEAVALLQGAGGAEGFRAVCNLAERLLPDVPDAALRLAEEAVVRARGMAASDRAWALAQAGELVFRAGKTDTGRKLIEEAAGLVEPLGHDGLDGYLRGMVACRVALYDAARARKMIDPIKQATAFNRYLAQACVRLAGRDLPTAKGWLADFRPGNSYAKDSAQQLMAYRLAAKDPDEAVALAESIDDRTIRALTVGGVAVRIAPKDRARAAKLIDAALDRIVADPTGYSANNGGGGGTAALLLYRAKQAGHPDLAWVRDRVLAARSAASDGPFRPNQDAVLRFALALGLTDPDSARLMLARALPPAGYLHVYGLAECDKLFALALIDPGPAMAAVDAILARAVKSRQGYGPSGLLGLAKALTATDVAAAVARQAGLFWDFEEE